MSTIPKIYITIFIAFISIILLLWLMPFSIVRPGYRGVITTFGNPKEVVYSEGIHFVMPVSQTMHTVDVSIQKAEANEESASKDLQTVHVTTLLNYHIDPKAVVSVFVNLGNEAEIRIVNPALQEAVKAVTAKYTAEELISKRIEVRNDIISTLMERLDRHGIKIDEFSILNFNFSKSFNEAIEAKTTAEQLKLKAERDLQRIQVEGQQKIVSAKAEAEGLAAQRQQITTELLELRKIENEKAAIEKWNGELPTYSGGVIPFINMGK